MSTTSPTITSSPTTAKLTERYIAEHPSIKDCLKKDLINYSKLSREIAKELSIEKKTSIEAILIACRRYAAKLKQEEILEKRILDILKKSELDIKNKIVVAIIDKKIYLDNLINIEEKIRKSADVFYAIEGTRAFTVITSEKYLKDLKSLFDIIKVSKDLAMVTVRSPENIEDVPGVVSYLYSIFGEHGVNIVETMSCWTDTIFVVSEDDLPLVLKFLKF
jgi:hypothetical protein